MPAVQASGIGFCAAVEAGKIGEKQGAAAWDGAGAPCFILFPQERKYNENYRFIDTCSVLCGLYYQDGAAKKKRYTD